MKKAFSLVICLAMLFSFVSPALAGEEGPITGSFLLTVPPAVTGISVYSDEALSIVPLSLTPAQTYWIKVSVSDNDSLDDLASIKVLLAGGPHEVSVEDMLFNGFSAKSHAEIYWNASENAISIYDWTGSSWRGVKSIAHPLPTPEVLADGTTSSYDFVFKVTIGKVAQETVASYEKWNVAAMVTDKEENHTVATYTYAGAFGIPMNWYGEIVIPEGAYVKWGSVESGMKLSDSGARTYPVQDVASVPTQVKFTYISNGAYAIGAKVTAANLIWKNSNSGTITLKDSHNDAVDTFSMKYAGQIVADPLTSNLAVSLLESSISSFITDANIGTDDPGINIYPGYLYLSLSKNISNPGKYTGAINFLIANK